MDKKVVLLSLARASIAEAVGLEYDLNLENILEENSWLKDDGASFVTLNTKNDGALRGCIGSIVAHRKLYEDIIHNARSAALDDPRFCALSKNEFEHINVEVSILTQPQRIDYNSIGDLKSKVCIGIDGVVLKEGSYQATFLPQVWEQLPTFELFFSHLCQKARLSSECLESKPDIFVYQVEKYKED